jgi:site-specific DNA recombinase
MDRPSLKRLLADIEAGQIDCIVVYKVDRLSRSLLDFSRIIETFDKHGVSFVSVAQQFNTTNSLGRLTLNILLSFAFEREIISERTRDKMSAARRKGKWIGGMPMLGYDVDPKGGKLRVNEVEAQRVRQIFKQYLEHGSLIPTVRALNGRGWTTKGWTTKDGRERLGQPFTKNGLFRLLTNVVYAGKVNHKGTIFPGEHPAVVPDDLWEKVNAQIRQNSRTGGREARNNYGALLRGILHCATCGTSMVHTYTAKGTRRYRYYVCWRAQQQGGDACKTKSVAAPVIEDSVHERIRVLATDESLIRKVIEQVRAQRSAGRKTDNEDRQTLTAELQRLNRRLARAAADTRKQSELPDLNEQILRIERKLLNIGTANDCDEPIDSDIGTTLHDFSPLWEKLTTRERTLVVQTAIERISYDGTTGQVSVIYSTEEIRKMCEGVESKTT